MLLVGIMFQSIMIALQTQVMKVPVSHFQHQSQMTLQIFFFRVLESADRPLYGCGTKFSQLQFVSRLMSIKADHNWSEASVTELLLLLRDAHEGPNTIPESFYAMRKLVSDLGLPVHHIDTCRSGCMLFWKDDKDLHHCKFCGEERYKNQKGIGDGVTRKLTAVTTLRYLPLAPRLQRLYASVVTASEMSWHKNHESPEGMMCHPSDSPAWKHFDTTYPRFAKEARNVRLGLCTDGFAPHGQYGKNYSCWPVILTPYNLPPGMCMKSPYMFLTLIIPGPNNPKNKIDVYMQPLIDELKMLWDTGVVTFDAARKELFRLHVCVLWTISDFPAYGMLSGWSTAGIMSCPICMENTSAFYLKYSRKPCHFDCHRKFLPLNHSYRKDKTSFLKDKIERSAPPPRLNGGELWARVRSIPSAIKEPNEKPSGYGVEHKWTKQSIFWELPYWKNLLIRHNLDLMHTEKNVFDNIFNTVMGVKGKTKDGLMSRKDIALYCSRPDIEVQSDSVGPINKSVYTVTHTQAQCILEWITSLQFPDGYMSNLKRCVNFDESRLMHMKSHDCHVFMQRLIPIAFRDMLPPHVWGCLTEISMLFQTLCSVVLDTTAIQDLERTVPILMCNMEKIFPPAFFDHMEHLIIHLPYEAKVAGTAQYRWMYIFERFLRELKKKVKNKAHVEASICQAYITEEISTFASYYFESHVRCKQRRVGRNDDGGGTTSKGAFSIFNYPGRGSGKKHHRFVVGEELRIAQTYILVNCPEVDPYLRQFIENFQGQDESELDKLISSQFAKWFKDLVHSPVNGIGDPLLSSLAWGPKSLATTWPMYFINGYNYHTVERGLNKATYNSGVCVRSSNYANSDTDWYGCLEEIIQLDYPGPMGLHVVLFKCSWIDPIKGVRKHAKYNIVDVNFKYKYKMNEPFILAQQAMQVYYASYPSMRKGSDWLCACKTSAKRAPIENVKEEEFAYQTDEPDAVPQIDPIETMPPLRDPNGIELHVDPEDAIEPTNAGQEDSDQDEGQDSDESEDVEVEVEDEGFY
ncbi:unnamed protein product [Cuscuta epithymum]|uniref:Uncharacterized protein n=1 Tax=Cuscuta epithymum TaxID=186058 RepID=A0AAV0G2Q4_9ASTE|nr:unnamed protein product [Cuscuta epithymum]